ncbi:hypothetical protein E2C01_015803 [Portunus trituberculatus]|uniref:Uncharacterized protein n=1 Tax=Portunus trituberculatus TaxID=210409 RepID=A0A5B7DNS8_PORTR|nr:hypothetical protein [Portunus trituberculatus]
MGAGLKRCRSLVNTPLPRYDLFPTSVPQYTSPSQTGARLCKYEGKEVFTVPFQTIQQTLPTLLTLPWRSGRRPSSMKKFEAKRDKFWANQELYYGYKAHEIQHKLPKYGNENMKPEG